MQVYIQSPQGGYGGCELVDLPEPRVIGRQGARLLVEIPSRSNLLAKPYVLSVSPFGDARHEDSTCPAAARGVNCHHLFSANRLAREAGFLSQRIERVEEV